MEKLLIGIVCGLIGGFVGHRLAIGRDIRKEYNDVIMPIKHRLLAHIDELEESASVSNPITVRELKPSRLYISKEKYKQIIVLHEQYKKILENNSQRSNSFFGSFIIYSENDRRELAGFVSKQNAILRKK